MIHTIDLYNPKNMTEEDWEQLKIEAEQIEREINESPFAKDFKEPTKEESDEIFRKIKARIKEYEDAKRADRFLKAIFGDCEEKSVNM